MRVLGSYNFVPMLEDDLKQHARKSMDMPQDVHQFNFVKLDFGGEVFFQLDVGM